MDSPEGETRTTSNKAIKDLDSQFGYFRVAIKDLDIQFGFFEIALKDLKINFGEGEGWG